MNPNPNPNLDPNPTTHKLRNQPTPFGRCAISRRRQQMVKKKRKTPRSTQLMLKMRAFLKYHICSRSQKNQKNCWNAPYRSSVFLKFFILCCFIFVVPHPHPPPPTPSLPSLSPSFLLTPTPHPHSHPFPPLPFHSVPGYFQALPQFQYCDRHHSRWLHPTHYKHRIRLILSIATLFSIRLLPWSPVASGLVKGNKTLAMTCVKTFLENPAVQHLYLSLLLSLLSCLLFVLSSCCVLPCLVLSCACFVLILGIHPKYTQWRLCHAPDAFRLRVWGCTPSTLFRSLSFASLSLSLSLSRTPPIRLPDTQSIAYARSFYEITTDSNGRLFLL